MGHLSKVTAAVGIAALLIVAGGAYALASSGHGTISVCVKHGGGTLYRARTCAKRDKTLTWNKQGVAGRTGPQGPQGVQGQAGQTGQPGAPGACGGSSSSGASVSCVVDNDTSHVFVQTWQGNLDTDVNFYVSVIG
jgi:hypothetical protein